MFKYLFFLLLLSSLSPSARASCAADKSDCRLETAAGTLEIEGESNALQTIKVAGKEIYSEETGFLYIKDRFPKTGVPDIVLISTESGGNGCEATFLVVHTPKKPGKVTISKPIGNCYLPEIEFDGKKLSLGFAAQGTAKAEYWTFQNGKLSPAKAKGAFSPAQTGCKYNPVSQISGDWMMGENSAIAGQPLKVEMFNKWAGSYEDMAIEVIAYAPEKKKFSAKSKIVDRVVTFTYPDDFKQARPVMKGSYTFVLQSKGKFVACTEFEVR